MQNKLLLMLSLACVLAISGCATSGRVAKPVACPVLPVPPASLMQPPTTETTLRGELFEPAQPATRK